ncbi:MAG: hypothetical protein GDA46_04960 [Bdellovibrionales bacterium]|nr:hypothetical protein [Bdellovibrionales bacterium]
MKRYKVFSIFEYLFLFVFFILSVTMLYLNREDLNFKTHQAFENKQFELAQKYLNESIKKEPTYLFHYLNLALSYDFLKQINKAEEIYEVASSKSFLKNPNIFYVYFNRAEFYSRLGAELDQALKFYQKALELNYKSEVIKKNIEWLFKKSNNQKDSSNKNEEEKKQDDLNQKQELSKKNQEGKKQEGEEKIEENEVMEQGKKDAQKNQKSPSENLSKDQNSYKSQEGKSLEEKAILEEIQKQENKVRSEFYKQKESFGSKTDKSW